MAKSDQKAAAAAEIAAPQKKTDEELLAEMEAEEAANAKAKRLEAERVAAEEAAKVEPAPPYARMTPLLFPEPEIRAARPPGILVMLDGFTDERHLLHMRFAEMVPLLSTAAAKSEGELRFFLEWLSTILH